MRKILVLAMAVLLLLPSFAFAEEATEWLYTHPEKGYQIRFPDGFLLVTGDNLDAVLELIDDGEIDDATSAIVRSATNVIASSNSVMIIAPDNELNLVIAFDEYGETFSTDVLIHEACPMFIEMYEERFPGFQTINPGTVWEVNGLEFVIFIGSAIVDGEEKLISQAFLSANDTLYSLAFTMLASADFEAMDVLSAEMIASFIPAG